MAAQSGGKVPQVRFKGFGGEWEDRRLGTVCTIGDADHWMPETTAHGIPYVMTGDFCGINEIDFENAKLISQLDFEKLSRKIKPEYGDILFARYASIGSVRYINTTRKFIASYSCAILKGSRSFNGEYLFFLLQSSNIQNQLKESINTGSQGNVGIESLKQLATPFPALTEQTQIGKYFRELDSLIGLHQRKHDKLVTLKKAMLQKMFPQAGATTPEIRFKGFTGGWKSKRIDEIAPLQRGFDLPTTTVRPGPYPVAYSNGILRFHDEYRCIAPGVVTGRSGTIGKVTFVSENYWPHNTSLWVTNFFHNDPLFIHYFYVQFKLDRFNAGSTIPTLNRNDVHAVRTNIPCAAEQQKIGTYFRQLDALISKHAIQLQKLQQLKSACLEKMFV